MMTVRGLLDAASVLDAQAEGRTPDRARVLAGALALDSLCLKRDVDRDIRDAAAGLRILAEGRPLDLDESGRTRAARLAELLRETSIGPAGSRGKVKPVADLTGMSRRGRLPTGADCMAGQKPQNDGVH